MQGNLVSILAFGGENLCRSRNHSLSRAAAISSGIFPADFHKIDSHPVRDKNISILPGNNRKIQLLSQIAGHKEILIQQPSVHSQV